MTSLDRTISLLPSKLRNKTQLPKLATMYIRNSNLVFKQNESFPVNKKAPLVLITNTSFDVPLSVTITYNDGQTYDFLIPVFTDQYQIFRLPLEVYEITNVVTNVLTITDEIITKLGNDFTDVLVEYAITLPATITNSDATVYTLNVDYELVGGNVAWDVGHTDITGAILHRTKATVTIIDYTTEATENTADDVPLMVTVGDAQVGDFFYVGADASFDRVIITMSTSGAGDYDHTLRYYNGSDWNTSPSNIVDGTENFKSTGKRFISFTEPTDWVKTDVVHDGGTISDKFWIRFELTALTSYTIQPLATRIWVDREPRKDSTYDITYDYVPSGDEGYETTFHILNGNVAKMMYIQDYGLSNVRAEAYKMFKYLELSNSESNWIDQMARSWGLNRLGGESDNDLRVRVVGSSSTTDGTTKSIIERLVSYLSLSSDPSISESFEITDSEGNPISWILDESQLLADNQSELILSGGDSIKPMQIVVNITGYTGALTETDIETYLRTILSVCTSPIVRLE